MQPLWMVTCDGQPWTRGLRSRAEAERLAKMMAEGCDSHIAGTKLRTGAFDVKADTNMMAEDDAAYKELKTHTTVQV